MKAYQKKSTGQNLDWLWISRRLEIREPQRKGKKSYKNNIFRGLAKGLM